jgi:uncharacterized protein (DUF1330 family)
MAVIGADRPIRRRSTNAEDCPQAVTQRSVADRGIGSSYHSARCRWLAEVCNSFRSDGVAVYHSQSTAKLACYVHNQIGNPRNSFNVTREASSNMRPRYALPATLVAGLGISVILTTALRAQGTLPAYVVAEVTIHDADTFARDYAPKVAGTLQPYGGRLLVSGGKLTSLEGDVPQRFVIIAFDNAEKARGWYDSPAYQQLVPIRQKTSKSTLFIAEGVSR